MKIFFRTPPPTSPPLPPRRTFFSINILCIVTLKLWCLSHRVAVTVTATALQKDSVETSGNTLQNRVFSNKFNINVNQPHFDKNVPTNVTALVGKTAYLNCKVKNLGNKTVSWVRHRDIHLLTVGRYTYTSDQRFRAINDPQAAENWTLMVKYPQLRDSGVYECQISTTPHISHFIYLGVVEPSTEILGAPDVYIDKGSTINLTCIISYSPEPPAYILWNHEDTMISYDSPRGGVNVITEKGDTTTSYLLIQKATEADNGRYQCSPSNGQPKSIQVHVLNGEHPAAVQHGEQAHHRSSHTRCLILCVLLLMLIP